MHINSNTSISQAERHRSSDGHQPDRPAGQGGDLLTGRSLLVSYPIRSGSPRQRPAPAGSKETDGPGPPWLILPDRAGSSVPFSSSLAIPRASRGREDPTMKIHFDLLEIESAERLAAVRALLQLLDEAIPEYEDRERTSLRELVAKRNLDFDEYDIKRQILDNRFRFWLPRFAAYSVLTLLYSVLEVQLHGCARRVQKNLESPFGPRTSRVVASRPSPRT